MDIYKKKLKKAISWKDEIKVKQLKDIKPIISINHIIRERYFEFEDALKDLDDCLNSIALFSSLPSHWLYKIDPERIKINKMLIVFFKGFVIS